MLSGYGFLSRKPTLIVLNFSEGQKEPAITYTHKHSQMCRSLQGKLEMDIAQLPPETRRIFLQDTGSKSPA